MATEVDVKEPEVKHPFEDAVKAENAKLSGVGTRGKYGMTRGKGSIPIKWQAFDESQPDTLPKTLAEFANVAKIDPSSEAGKAKILEYLIVGFNDDQYTQASDPIAEFVNPTWSEDKQLQFRLVVRNFVKAMNGAFTIEAAGKMFREKLDAV